MGTSVTKKTYQRNDKVSEGAVPVSRKSFMGTSIARKRCNVALQRKGHFYVDCLLDLVNKSVQFFLSFFDSFNSQSKTSCKFQDTLLFYKQRSRPKAFTIILILTSAVLLSFVFLILNKGGNNFTQSSMFVLSCAFETETIF